MTQPNPISKYRPSNDDNGERQPFTDKNELAGVPLIITEAKNIPGRNGRFWVIQASRQDTGELITFNGSKVIDEVIAAVDAAKAYPVAAMLVKVEADNPQGFYWNIVDPPAGSESAPSNGELTNDSGPDRIEQVQKLLDRYKAELSTTDVTEICAEITGVEGTKVRDLDDPGYALLLKQLEQRGLDKLPEAPF